MRNCFECRGGSTWVPPTDASQQEHPGGSADASFPAPAALSSGHKECTCSRTEAGALRLSPNFVQNMHRYSRNQSFTAWSGGLFTSPQSLQTLFIHKVCDTLQHVRLEEAHSVWKASSSAAAAAPHALHTQHQSICCWERSLWAKPGAPGQINAVGTVLTQSK